MRAHLVAVILSGRPGTGKTTLGRTLAAELGAAFLRIDSIETAVVRSGLVRHPVGPVGYVVAHEIAAATLAVGTSVVVDAVNPVPEARAGWRPLADLALLVMFETVLPDEAEHRRRVTSRRPDLPDQRIPTWQDVQTSTYVPWDVDRDGARHVIDTTDSDRAATAALALLVSAS